MVVRRARCVGRRSRLPVHVAGESLLRVLRLRLVYGVGGVPGVLRLPGAGDAVGAAVLARWAARGRAGLRGTLADHAAAPSPDGARGGGGRGGRAPGS